MVSITTTRGVVAATVVWLSVRIRLLPVRSRLLSVAVASIRWRTRRVVFHAVDVAAGLAILWRFIDVVVVATVRLRAAAAVLRARFLGPP